MSLHNNNNYEDDVRQHKQRRQLVYNNFAHRKIQCLGKRDKSSAGRIDPKAVDICALINSTFDEFYTTSSCAGRCFLYRGQGTKSHNKNINHANTHFSRFRISHDLVRDPERYFNLETIDSDLSGGGDPIRTVSQFDHAEQLLLLHEQSVNVVVNEGDHDSSIRWKNPETPGENKGTTDVVVDDDDGSIWLRFEPFILHVACRSLEAASTLMNAARPVFKNVGLTAWNHQAKYLVAIWGDEGLDMPLCAPGGLPLFHSTQHRQWLADLVNQRHKRNWEKIDRFVQQVRQIDHIPEGATQEGDASVDSVPKSYDVVGDIAILNSISDRREEDEREIGEAIMEKNKGIKVVVARQSKLNGSERAPGTQGLRVIAGMNRSPLITTHSEYGIRCVIDLERTFFTPRMGPERLRICQQVARGEKVLVLFAGVCMDALQIAGRTEAEQVIAVELNKDAVECGRRSHRMLERNKAVKCVGAAERLQIIHEDVLEVLPTLLPGSFDRIVAPRPKQGTPDGDLGDGEGGIEFLEAIVPILKPNVGECHWYDFVADHEFPNCERVKRLLEKVCSKHSLKVEIIHVAKVGSVAMRQYRICIDFRVYQL